MLALYRINIAALALSTLAGCGWVSQGKFTSLESQSRILSEQNKAQLAEIENLKVHARNVEDQLIRAEQAVAKQQPKPSATNEAQLVASHKTGLAPGRPFATNASAISADVSTKLSALARRYKHLQFDPETGISKLDTDVLFPSGDTQLKPEADRLLREFAHILQQPDATHLKVMVVGHTDDAGPKGREIRSKYPNNWTLSTARAVAVAERLKAAGLPEERMGVAGYADHQPISPNDTVDSRSRNRRVEIFVVGPDTPIVGWTETHASVYQ
jgi:chemotaxis protein MotB